MFLTSDVDIKRNIKRTRRKVISKVHIDGNERNPSAIRAARKVTLQLDVTRRTSEEDSM